MADPILRLEGISKVFHSGGLLARRRGFRALDQVSLTVQPGQAFGIVGESGSGKSTLCRVALGLIRPSEGRVTFKGHQLLSLSQRDLRQLRREMQAVFQDTMSSFNPRQTVKSALLAPLEVHRVGTPRERLRMVSEALEHVGMDSTYLERHPHQLSGGQRQRVAIARSIILRPSLVVADEPTSALDVSVQARILNLLRDIQADLGLTYLFVSHNLGVIRHVCDTVAVMYLGQIVEMGPIEEVFLRSRHPYTQALLASVPQIDPARRRPELPIMGEVPSGYALPSGCRFHSRCPVALPRCKNEAPASYSVGPGHVAACFLHESAPAYATPATPDT